MNTSTQTLPRDLQLQHKALYSLPDASSLAVTCEDGVLWLTVDGDRATSCWRPANRSRPRTAAAC
jgi:hypothetical protein